MYNYISGSLVEKQDGFIVVDNAGIGYEIRVSNQALDKMPTIGEYIKIYVFQNVKEDEISLYGFYNLNEKNMFLNLIEVNGIGPKMAMGVLSSVRLQDLEMAIISGDHKTLSKLKGIGAKTAERIVLELKDKLQKNQMFEVIESQANNVEMEDAIMALEGLGLNRIDAVKRVREVATSSDKAEEIVAKVLKGRV